MQKKKKKKYKHVQGKENDKIFLDQPAVGESQASETPYMFEGQRIALNPDIMLMIEQMPAQDQILAQRLLADNLTKPIDSSGNDLNRFSSSMKQPLYGASSGAGLADEQMVFKKISDLSMSSSHQFKTAENRSSMQTPARSPMNKSKLSSGNDRSLVVTPQKSKKGKKGNKSRVSQDTSISKSRSKSDQSKLKNARDASNTSKARDASNGSPQTEKKKLKLKKVGVN